MNSQLSQSEREEGIALLKQMPPDANPFEYLHNMKKAIIRNTTEEAIAKLLFQESVAAVKFDLRHSSQVPEQNAKTTLPPPPTHKFASKSAPSSPSKSFNNASTITKDNEKKRDGNNSKESSPKRLKGATSTSTLTKGSLGEGPSLEGALTQFKAVILYSKEFLTRNKNAVGRDRVDIARESFFLLRRLCKNIVDLLTCAKFELTSSHSQLIRKGVKIVYTIYQKYSKEEEALYKQLFSTDQTGIAFLVDNVINYLADPNSDDAYSSLMRGNLAHEIFDELKSLPIRHYIYRRLCEALKTLLFRSFVPSVGRRGKASLIDYGEINLSFRYLQLIEFIIFTTGSIHDGPWLEELEVKGLKHMEKKYSRTKNPFANVLTFLSRVIIMAVKLKKQPIEDK